MKKFLVIDGNALLFSGFYATYKSNKMLTSPDGTPINAIQILGNVIINLLQEQYDYVLVALDSESKTFRHQADPNYKATRTPPPNELIPQFSLADQFYDLLGLHPLRVEGYEADDIIGTISKYASDNDIEVTIVSGDRDLLQLVNDKVSLSLPNRKSDSKGERILITPNNIIELYGYLASQVTDYKALVGDASDNIKGVKGIGEKTALALLSTYTTLDNIYVNINSITGKKQTLLLEGKESAYLSKSLATLCLSVPMNLNLSSYLFSPLEKDKINSFCQKYGLKQLNEKILKLNINFTEPIQDINNTINYTTVDSLSLLDTNNPLAIYLEYLGDYHLVNIKRVLVTDGKKIAIFNDFTAIKPILVSKTPKYCLSLKELVYFSLYYDIKLSSFTVDLSLIAYLKGHLDTTYTHSVLPFFNCNIPLNSSDTGIDNVIAIYDIASTIVLTKEERYLYDNFDLPLVAPLALIEYMGVNVDVNVLTDLKEEFTHKLQELETKIRTYSDTEINISSPKQIADLLFNKLSLPRVKNDSTSIEVLEELKNKHENKHEIITLIINHRKYAKILSTYLDGLLPHIVDNKIHSHFSLTLTATGRLSSYDPNIQNIATRDEEQKLVKKIFIAPKNRSFISFDYSQIELRVLALISQDKSLLASFAADQDIHTLTASLIYKIPYDQVSKAQRAYAKKINFSIIYGVTPYALSKDLNISMSEAKAFITNYYQTFPSLKNYFDNAINSAKENGYVTTLFGRKRAIPELLSTNKMIIEQGYRLVYNTPIQGTAADIMRRALIAVNQYLSKYYFSAYIVNQIHDELILEVDNEDIDRIVKDVTEIMENIIKDKMILKVEHEVGASWWEI